MADKTVKELKEERGFVKNEIDVLLAKPKAENNRDFNLDEAKKLEALEVQFDTLENDIKKAEIYERHEARSRDLAQPQEENIGRQNRSPQLVRGVQSELTRDLAIEGWMRGHVGCKLHDNQRKAMTLCGYKGGSKRITIPLNRSYARKFGRPLGTQPLSQSGYLNEPSFVPGIEAVLTAYGGMREVCQVRRTENGNPITWNLNDDASNKGHWVAEGSLMNEVLPSISQFTLNAYKISSDYVGVNEEEMEDASIDFGSWLAELLGTRIARGLNEAYTVTGGGTTRPTGILDTAAAGITAADDTTFTVQEIIAMINSVDDAYGKNGKFMMHQSVFYYSQGLASDQGLLFQPDLHTGFTKNWFGHEVVINNDMPATVNGLPVASAVSFLFGDFSQFVLREVNQVRFYRLNERYRDLDQTAFVAFMRADSNQKVTKAIKKFTQHA